MADKFDPDAFIRERTSKKFDPEAFLSGPFAGARAAAEAEPTPAPVDSKGRKPAKDPGALRAIGSKALQGFFKEGSDEVAGAITRLAVDPGVGWKQPDGSVQMLKTEGDLYRAGRDAEREVLRGAEDNWPWLSRAAQVMGDLGSDAVLGALGVPVTSRGYNTAVGALSGFMGSDTDLTPDKATAGDAASAGLSTVVGGTLGRYLPDLAQAGLRRATPVVARALRRALESRALQSGRRVLLAGADQLARVRPPSDEVVREALDSGAIPFFGTTRGAADRLNTLAEEQGNTYGGILERLQALGVEGPSGPGLSEALRARSAELTPTAGIADPAIPRVSSDVGERIAESYPVGNMPLTNAEAVKRALQDRVRYGLIEDTPLNEERAAVAAMLRRGIEDKVDEALMNAPANSELDALAGAFMPVKQRLARTLGASEAANKGAAAAAKRGEFSLTDYLWALAAGGGTGAGSGNTLGGALAAGAGLMGHKLLRERGPSSVAATTYGLAQALRGPSYNPTGVNRELGALTGRAVDSDTAAKIAEWLRDSGKAKKEDK